MAQANGVHISMGKWCKPRSGAYGRRRCIIISDIDGGELELFGLDTIGALRRCDLIIEMHGDDSAQNQEFVKRFQHTHRTQVIGQPQRYPTPETLAFLGEDAARMAAEYRGFQEWLIAEPL
jgi:hypothetical protein